MIKSKIAIRSYMTLLNIDLANGMKISTASSSTSSDTMINSERFEREEEIESFYYSLLMNNEIYNGFYTMAIHLEFVTEY